MPLKKYKVEHLNIARILAALRASLVHLFFSILVAAIFAALVFLIWYPLPYVELAGGKELFLLVVGVDVICGPLLTLVLFDTGKPKKELWRDLGLVAIIQLAALGYGIYNVWIARPIFLVMEIDRFKVVNLPDLDSTEARSALDKLPASLKSNLWSGPVVVAIREPVDAQERKDVLFESIQDGRDYAQRPDFYLPYEGDAAKKSLSKARPLALFLEKQPSQKVAAAAMATAKRVMISQWVYVPVIGRKDWIAILNNQGGIEGFLPGDGF